MHNHDLEYFRLLKLVLEQGRWANNRTGCRTKAVFGAQSRFDLNNGFPLLTTKKIYFKAVVHELLWMLSGSTNIKYLVDNDIHIWDDWAYARYRKTPLESLKDGAGYVQGRAGEYKVIAYFEKDVFIASIRNSPKFAKQWGELGEGTYGGMWRAFPYVTGQEVNLGDVDSFDVDEWGIVDQISKLIDKLKTNPDDRRLIVSAWHPYWSEKAALAPCHCLFQFHTEELTLDERWNLFKTPVFALPKYIANGQVTAQGKIETLNRIDAPTRRLNCQLYQRSCDLFLGVPFNIASYALLTHMVAQVVNMIPGTFIHTFGDLHLYENHLNQVDEQLSREPKNPPTLVLNPEVKDIFEFKFEDITIKEYNPHPTIKAKVSV